MTDNNSVLGNSPKTNFVLGLLAGIAATCIVVLILVFVNMTVVGNKLASTDLGVGGGDGSDTTGNTNAAPTEPQPEEPAKPVPAISADDHVIGDPKAKVVVIEYSDFQCPYCGAFHGSPAAQSLIDSFKAKDPNWKPAYPNMYNDYIKTGKIAFVFRQFPLSFHQYAIPAGNAAECAGEQGKFWEMHELLFAKQDKLTDTDLKGYAKTLGLNTAKFDSCLSSGKFTTKMNNQMAGGSASGVNGTPATFINGKLISGAVGYDTIKQIIDSEL